MAASFRFSLTYGASPGTVVGTATYLNLVSADVAATSSTAHQSNRVIVPAAGAAYTYERWLRGKWTGTFSSVSDVRFWHSSGTPDTGVTIWAKDIGSQTYATPQLLATTSGFTNISTVNTGTLSLGYATNYSDYAVLLGRVASTATGPDDSAAAMTYTMQWNEA